MRQIQREAKAREKSRNTPVKALWKSSNYDSVESRVKDFMQVKRYFLILRLEGFLQIKPFIVLVVLRRNV